MIERLKELLFKKKVIKELRCKNCGTLLAKDFQGHIEIKCKRCKTINKL